MRQKLHNLSERKGVSSVIAVALMVAVTVALVGLISVVVFNFTDGGDGDDSVAGASVDLTATQDGVQVTLIRSGNADEFVVNVDGETVGETLTEEGDTTTVAYEGLYSVIGKFGGGEEEVITTKRVEGVLNGLFTVFQDQEDGTVEAQLVERYQNDDEYTIVTDTSGSDDGSTTSFSFSEEEDDGRLLSRQDGELLQDLPDQVPDQATNVVGIGDPDVGTASNNPLEVGDKAKLHKMMGSWCEGDDILLVGEDGQTVLDGDEFAFDNNCGGLQTIAQYNDAGTELTSVKLINRWRQSVDYSMFAYDGNVEPPQIGVANAGSLNFDVEVYEQNSGSIDTDSPIEGAEVVIGNKAGQTDTAGSISFEEIPAGEQYFVTVNAGGFDGTQSPITAVGDGSGNFDSIKLDGTDIKGDGTVSATSDDEGVYKLNASNGVLQIGLKNFSPDIRTIEQSSVDSGNSTTVYYSNFSVSSGTQVSLSTGSSGSDANSGGSGSSSYDGGSATSGASFYSGGSTTTTQEVQTNSRVIREGSEYTPEPPNNNISQTEASTSTDDTPTRSLKVGKLDDSEIPVDDGAQIELQMSAQTYSEQQVDDTFNIYKAPVNDGGTGSITKIDSVNVTLPPGNDGNPGNEVTESESITITSSDGSDPNEGAFQAGNEYVMYVALQSVGEPKEAGTIDVFDGDLTGYTLDLSSSTANIDRSGDGNYDDVSDLSNAIVGDNLQITLDSVVNGSITANPTVDLYRNGELVKRVDNYDNGQITYQESLDQAQYVDYHVGLKEATETALFDTAVVQEVDPSSDTQDQITEFNAKLTLNDVNSICDSTLSDGNYDCTFKEGGDLNFDAGGTFTGDDINRQDVSYSLEFGNGRVESKNYDSNNTASSDDYSIGYSNSGTYLVQLTATFTDSNGNELSDVDTATVNVQKPSDEVTGRFVGGGTIGGSENFQLDFESTRSTTDEKVDIIIQSAVQNPSSETVDVSGSYKVRNDFTLEGGVTESIEVSVPEVANALSPDSASEDDSIAALTSEDSNDVASGYGSSVSAGEVPLYVRVENSDDTDSTSPKGDQEIIVKPDGQIQANIQADVIVNPVITLSSTDDGDGTISIKYNDYGNSNTDSFDIIKPDGSTTLVSLDGSNDIGTTTNVNNVTDTGEYTIKNTTDGTNVRTVFVNNP